MPPTPAAAGLTRPGALAPKLHTFMAQFFDDKPIANSALPVLAHFKHTVLEDRFARDVGRGAKMLQVKDSTIADIGACW